MARTKKATLKRGTRAEEKKHRARIEAMAKANNMSAIRKQPRRSEEDEESDSDFEGVTVLETKSKKGAANKKSRESKESEEISVAKTKGNKGAMNKKSRESKESEEFRVTKTKGKKGGIKEKSNESKEDAESSKANFETESGAKEQLPSLHSRAVPNELVNALNQVNKKQKEAIVEMGFGKLFALNVKRIPSKLAYWVLDNYDANSSTLRMNNGSMIEIDEQDVHLVLGFPRGNELIRTRQRSDYLLEEGVEWFQQFDKNYFNGKKIEIKVSALMKKVLEDGTGGPIFKQNFLVLLTSCLIENKHNGYITPQLLGYMDKTKLDTVHNLNWCEYVLRSLIQYKTSWQKTKSNSFQGPTLFLTALYVDRVVTHGRRLVERCFPTITGWDFAKLRQRQMEEINAGGFGGGRVCAQLVVLDSTSNISLDTETEQGAGDSDKVGNPGDDIYSFAKRFLDESKVYSDSMVRMIVMLESAPKHVSSNQYFKKMTDAARQLLGCNSETVLPSQDLRQTQMFDKDEIDEFWNDEECMAKLDDIAKAQTKRTDWGASMFDNFDLGFSPLRDNVIHISREYHDIGQNNFFSDGERSVGVDEVVKKRANDANDGCAVDKNVSTMEVEKLNVYKRKTSDTCMSLNDHFYKRMSTRPSTSLKLTDALMSPFRGRPIDVAENVTQKEKELFYWAVHAKNRDMNEVVFSYKDTHLLRREEMRSMKADEWISTHVIDVWSTMLNQNEAYKAKSSPLRFFASTYPCAYTIVDPPANMSSKETEKNFFERLDLEINSTKIHSLDKIDMYFFPVLISKHYYIVCFDLKKNNTWIIDNSEDQDDHQLLRERYSSTPFILQNKFCDYLVARGYELMAKRAKSCIVRMQMPWRALDNFVDCGIYTMRHMENYMGECPKSWKCGLFKGNGPQMKRLRMKYTAAILSSPMNTHSDNIVKEARCLFGAENNIQKLSVASMLK